MKNAFLLLRLVAATLGALFILFVMAMIALAGWRFAPPSAPDQPAVVESR